MGGALPLDLSKLPEEWVLRQGNELRVYVSYLIACKLQRITPQQVIEAHAKRHGEVWNTLPPRNLWRQIVPTLRVVDRLSMELGQPVGEIVSAYRSPVYNSTCEGAKSRSAPGECRAGREVRCRALDRGDHRPVHAHPRPVSRRCRPLRQLHAHRYPRRERRLVSPVPRAWRCAACVSRAEGTSAHPGRQRCPISGARNFQTKEP